MSNSWMSDVESNSGLIVERNDSEDNSPMHVTYKWKMIRCAFSPLRRPYCRRQYRKTQLVLLLGSASDGRWRDRKRMTIRKYHRNAKGRLSAREPHEFCHCNLTTQVPEVSSIHVYSKSSRIAVLLHRDNHSNDSMEIRVYIRNTRNSTLQIYRNSTLNAIIWLVYLSVLH